MNQITSSLGWPVVSLNFNTLEVMTQINKLICDTSKELRNIQENSRCYIESELKAKEDMHDVANFDINFHNEVWLKPILKVANEDTIDDLSELIDDNDNDEEILESDNEEVEDLEIPEEDKN
ncbi:hypothetical protein FQR65_LT12515 [Abscondita terminalis]|nr:hypothetical protein FQR65_LT12515 [Abscondita terminalis]